MTTSAISRRTFLHGTGAVVALTAAGRAPAFAQGAKLHIVRWVDFIPEASESVFHRMESERKRVANEQRSNGAADAEKIRADADRQREVLLAEAYRDAQRIKGDGDARASATYAQAFGANPEFYAFYRSLEAYKQSFRKPSDMLMVDPSSEFFKYMKNPGGSATAR